MKYKWILAIILCIAVVAIGFYYINSGGLDITGATTVDLKNFDYSAIINIEDFPKVNVTGVIDNICLLPSLPLWDKAGGDAAGGNIAITVKGCPGTSMYVTGVQQYGNTTWYRVQKYEKRGDLQMIWNGWTTEKTILQGPLPIPLEEYQKMNQ